MKRVKRLITSAIAGAMILQSAIPALAAVTDVTTFDDGSVYIKTDNHLKYENYPCWIWKDGYCYYYQNAGTILKNTTTPDGYTVDELGRWTENGVPQHNGYGSVRMGTDEYIGKTDDEIWTLMKDKLIGVFGNAMVQGDHSGPGQNGIYVRADNYTYGYDDNKVWYDFDTSTYGKVMNVWHNYGADNTYLTVTTGGEWSDEESNVVYPVAKAYYAQIPGIVEKEIKVTIGDNIGQELFNYIKQHADKTSKGYIPVFDDNGNVIHGISSLDDNYNKIFIENPDSSDYKRVKVESGAGDGICAETMDLSAWKNRTTDYGKRFDVEPHGYAIKIKVYN